MELFRWLGVRRDSAPSLRYEVHVAEAARIQERLRGRPYVVIHPAAIMETKRWDAHRFAEVARGLAGRGFTIVVTSGPGEESFAGQVAREIQGTVILLGLTIPELAELIRGARLYIGNDSGPMHLAAALQVPTVAIFGPTNEIATGPLSPRAVVLNKKVECSPCLLRECPIDHRCMTRITVDEVYQHASRLLSA